MTFANDQAPRGLILDCDGTLADTMPLHWRAWQVITQRHGLRFPVDRFYALGGVPTRDILKMLSQEQGVPLDPVAVALEKEHEYLPLIAQVEPVNVVVGIARAHYGTTPLAVASGGTKKIITQVLEHLGIVELFDVIDAHWVSRTSCSGALSQVGTVESQSYVEPAATSDVDQLRPYGAGVGLWPAVGAAEATETAAVSNSPDSRAAPTSDRRRFFATLPFMEHQP